jgi:hypothetical protein
MTAADLREYVLELSEVGERSVECHLQMTLRFPARSAAQKQLLTPKVRKPRLAFTEEDWANIMYSDNSTF